MLKRARWLTMGFVLGLGSSWAVARRVRRIVARYAPAEVVERWNDNVQSLGVNVRAAVYEGRSAMQQRELELKSSLERTGGR